MKYLIAFALSLASLAAHAELPAIIGTMPLNKDGTLVFTSKRGSCKAGSMLVVLKSTEGAVLDTGCFTHVEDLGVIVRYGAGDEYIYGLDNFIVTDSGAQWYRANKGESL